jgi:hypothetical protein
MEGNPALPRGADHSSKVNLQAKNTLRIRAQSTRARILQAHRMLTQQRVCTVAFCMIHAKKKADLTRSQIPFVGRNVAFPVQHSPLCRCRAGAQLDRRARPGRHAERTCEGQAQLGTPKQELSQADLATI